MAGNIQKAYAQSQSIYDDVLTQSRWWSKLYIRVFWGGVDDVAMAGRVLGSIDDGFCGKLLDVPVGTGVFTQAKYAALPKAKITCLDYSTDMLAKAKARFSGDAYRHISCVQGDVGALPFADESFDAVLSMNGFHAFPDKQKAFAETFRVLKKGGVFLGCFYIKGQYKPTDFIVKRVLAQKGWFTPPFETLASLRGRLSSLYGQVDVGHEKGMAYFRCVK